MSTGASIALTVALSLAGSVAGIASSPIRISLVNASRHVIRKAYVSPSGSSSWGSNLLASKDAGSGSPPALKPRQRAAVNFSTECGRFDIRLVADGGTEFLEDEVELCDDDNVLTVTNDALEFTKASRP